MIAVKIEKALHGVHGSMRLTVDKEIKKGDFVAIMGESGAGKTTLLRVLAGLEDAQEEIVVEGRSWSALPPQKREIGFVFQDYALFENMSVEENLLFVNKERELCNRLLDITQLSTLREHNVTMLSGGQKQRVALCRALMKRPRVLLMDEPFSALDTSMKERLYGEIKQLHQAFGMTTIMVSHDVNTTFSLASRVWILHEGRIISDGTPQEVLLQKSPTYNTKVLRIHKSDTHTVATVYFSGTLLEVEVDADIKVGEMIEVSVKGVMV